MKIEFSENSWTEDAITTAYSFRFTETPRFTQEKDHIRTAPNSDHREGYDNVSLMTRENYSTGVVTTIHCSLEGEGCAEFVLAETLEECEDGAVRYGNCYEVALWQYGYNVWKYYWEDGKIAWKKLLGVWYPVAENTVHELVVKVIPQGLEFVLDGQTTLLRIEDLPTRFHIGLSGCEGLARIYDWEIKDKK